jgi:peptide/nickel transport system permease protein
VIGTPSASERQGLDLGPAARSSRPAAGVLAAVGKKVVIAVATVWIASVVVFLAVEILPQDPARAALGKESTEEQREAFREAHGLNDPAIDRYSRWLGGMVRGDFGESIVSGRPIADELWPRLRFTALLAATSVLISVVVGVPLALRAARSPGGAFDTVANLASVSVSAVPEFVVGLLLAYVLASWLGVLPVLSNGIGDGDWAALVLPAMTLGLMAVSYVFRFARVGVIEAAEAPFVRAAKLRGLSGRRVMWRHVLPVAASAVVNVVALNTIYLLGGVIVVENLFSYPGLGTLLLTGVNSNDFPVIEAVAVVTSGLLVIVNLVADAAVIALNPRLRSREHH